MRFRELAGLVPDRLLVSIFSRGIFRGQSPSFAFGGMSQYTTMTEKKLTRPKCGPAMVQGFIPDYSYGAIYVGGWQAGVPQKSFWVKTKAPLGGGLPIAAFRSEECGFLEFYSNAKFAAR